MPGSEPAPVDDTAASVPGVVTREPHDLAAQGWPEGVREFPDTKMPVFLTTGPAESGSFSGLCNAEKDDARLEQRVRCDETVTRFKPRGRSSLMEASSSR